MTLAAGAWLYYRGDAPAPASRYAIRVAAAISLRDAMDSIAKEHTARTGQPIELVFGSSGQLAAQIRHGAPIDIFISAAHEPVDLLSREGLLAGSHRWIIARNELVLVAPRTAGESAGLSGFSDLAGPRVRRLAIGDPSTVPAGQYAMQVLDTLDLSQALRERLIFGTNVRQVLDYVARGEVSAGLVYATDAALEHERVTVVATASPQWHRPIEYPAVLVKSSRTSEAALRFLNELTAPAAQEVLRGFGFRVAPSVSPTAESAP